MTTKPRLAIHKLTSCSGCQAVVLGLGEGLLALERSFDLVHFVEAGFVAPDSPVDIALIEGSVTTRADLERVQRIRELSTLVVAVGACACSGGIQALRNVQDIQGDWAGSIYASPELIDSLGSSVPVAERIKVDLELWGCPINSHQLLLALSELHRGVRHRPPADKVCLQCKRQQQVCLLVSQGAPCLGPVTRTGCGALCPAVGEACYGCFGPSEQARGQVFGERLIALGLPATRVAQRFASISIGAPEFRDTYSQLIALEQGSPDEPEES